MYRDVQAALLSHLHLINRNLSIFVFFCRWAVVACMEMDTTTLTYKSSDDVKVSW